MGIDASLPSYAELMAIVMAISSVLSQIGFWIVRYHRVAKSVFREGMSKVFSWPLGMNLYRREGIQIRCGILLDIPQSKDFTQCRVHRVATPTLPDTACMFLLHKVLRLDPSITASVQDGEPFLKIQIRWNS